MTRIRFEGSRELPASQPGSPGLPRRRHSRPSVVGAPRCRIVRTPWSFGIEIGHHVHTMPTRVLIVDDQAPFREAARTVVELTDGFEVVGESETGEDSVRAAAELRPDLVLMDVN